MKDYKQNFISIKEKYISFRKNLEEALENNNFSLKNPECYLINDIWDKEFKNSLDKIESIINNNSKKLNSTKINNYNIKTNPVIFNDISKTIDLLTGGCKLKLFDKELMEKIIDNNFLRVNNTVKYFCGNNLLIIEFKNVNNYEYEINSLLIINPPEKDKNNNNSLFISFKVKEEKKIEIYKQIFSNKNILDLKKNKNNNFFFNFEKILNPNNISSFYEEIKEFDLNKVIKTGILEILFYIYYYEEFLSTNDLNNIFKYCEGRNYSLINPKWIQKYKEFYNYESIYNFLKDNKNFISVNYNNLDVSIKTILDSYLAEHPNSKIKELPDNLLNIEEIKPILIEYEELSFYGTNYLISEKIIEMIKKNVFQNKFLSIQLNKIYAINNNIFLFDNKKLIIGNLFDEFLFKPKYILNYENSKTLESEKNLFISTSLEKYIEFRRCKINIIYEKQIMKNENCKDIGELIVLTNKSLFDDKNKINFKNLNKKEDIFHEVIIMDSKKKIILNNRYDSRKKRFHSSYGQKINYFSFSNNIYGNDNYQIQEKEIEKNEKEDLDNENKLKDNKIKKLKNKKEKIELKEKEILEKENEINKKNLEIKTINEEIQKKIEENKRIKKENNELNEKNEGLKKEINEKEKKYKNFMNYIENKNKEEEIKKYYEDLINKKKKEYEDLYIKYLDIENKLKNNENELENTKILNKENESYKNDITKREEELKEKIIELETKIIQINNKYKIDFEKKVKELTYINENNKIQLKNKQEEILKLNKEIENNRREKVENGKKIEQLLQKINLLEQKKKEFETKINILKIDLKNKGENIEKVNKKLMREIENKKKENNDLIIKNKNLEKQLNENKSKNKEFLSIIEEKNKI